MENAWILEEVYWIGCINLADTQTCTLHLRNNFICSLSKLHLGLWMKQYGSSQQNNSFKYIFVFKRDLR